MCIYHIFLIQSSVVGHLGCFHVLAIVNSAAMNVWVHASFSMKVFSSYMLRSGTAGPCLGGEGGSGRDRELGVDGCKLLLL